MSTNNSDLYSDFHLSGEDIAEMPFDDDYDPATDVCDLLWPVMDGIFAEELAEFVLQKHGRNKEE